MTRLVSTVCYHSPHLLAPVVAGLAPYTAAPHAEVPPSIRLVSLISTISSIYLSTHYTLPVQVITTVMAVVLSEKANNDPDLISKVVEVLLLCLDTTDKYIISLFTIDLLQVINRVIHR